MTKPTLISLFSGAGGLDYGFEAADFRTGVCVEMNHESCETLRASRRWSVIEDDIFNVPTAAMLEKAGRRAGEIDLVIGGPPCQPFSKAGYWASGDSARLNDPRAQTLEAYMRVVEEALPRVFLLENVQGLAFKGKDEGLAFLERRIRKIKQRTGHNYVWRHAVMNAVELGVPQQRQRLIIVGSRDGIPFQFPQPTHAPDRDQAELLGLPPPLTAWDALHDLTPDLTTHDLAMRGKYADLLPSIPEGQNYLWHTSKGRERAVAAGLKPGRELFGWRRHFWTFLLKLAKDRPSWTLQAQPGPAVGPFHWDNRRLSARELCRIQTMPDNVLVQGNLLAVQKQVGNAVPSLLGEVLGRAIRHQLLGVRAASRLQLLRERGPAPPRPRRPEPVPERYDAQEGEHSAHPGTGLGRGARSREAAVQMSLWA